MILGVRNEVGVQVFTWDDDLNLDDDLDLALDDELVSQPRAEVCGGANAPRRFAVWALRESTALRQAEIAKALSMSLRQVESVIRRIDLDAEPMKGWATAFEERLLASGETA